MIRDTTPPRVPRHQLGHESGNRYRRPPGRGWYVVSLASIFLGTLLLCWLLDRATRPEEPTDLLHLGEAGWAEFMECTRRPGAQCGWTERSGFYEPE